MTTPARAPREEVRLPTRVAVPAAAVGWTLLVVLLARDIWLPLTWLRAFPLIWATPVVVYGARRRTVPAMIAAVAVIAVAAVVEFL
jgi:hypothetical protein